MSRKLTQDELVDLIANAVVAAEDDEELDDDIIEELEEEYADEDDDEDEEYEDDEEEDLLAPGAAPALQERVRNRARQHLADIRPVESLPLPTSDWTQEQEKVQPLVANHDYLPELSIGAPHGRKLPTVLSGFVGNTGERARELLIPPTLDFSDALQRRTY